MNRVLWVVLLAVLLAAGPASAASKIRRDGSVGPKNPVKPPKIRIGGMKVFLIDDGLGQRSGKNLVHSFERFDLDSGHTALFTGDPVTNVIARITGGKPSRLDGRIRSNLGEKRFFFLNPSGVMFGPTSSIDVPGSFFLSTADVLRFKGGAELETGSADPPATLSTRSPSAFGFLGANPAGVTVDRAQLALADGATFQIAAGPIAFDGAPVGTLVGGDLIVRDEPSVVAAGGRILLVSVDSAGDVGVGDADPDLDGFERLGHIDLVGNVVLEDDDPDEMDDDDEDDDEDDNETALDEIEPALGLDVSGEGGGLVVLRSRVLEVRDWKISADAGNLGAPARSIDVAATERIELGGATELSSLFGASSLAPGASVEGGAVRVRAPVVRLVENAEILSDTTASDPRVRAGRVSIRAGKLVLAGDAEIASDADEGAAGQGGLVSVRADSITLRDGSEISSDTGGGGGGGRVEVHAEHELRIEDGAGIFTNSKAAGGTGGDISVGARDLVMRGGTVSAQAVGASDAGSIAIRGNDTVDLRDATVIASVQGGSGGNVAIQAEAVIVRDSAVVAQAIQGDGGNIQITTDLFFPENAIFAADSQFGVDGVVDFNTPEQDLTGSLETLPSDFLDATSLLGPRCDARRPGDRASHFAVVARRGLPASPEDWIVPALPAEGDAALAGVLADQDRGDYASSLALDAQESAARTLAVARAHLALGDLESAEASLEAVEDRPGFAGELEALLAIDRGHAAAIRGRLPRARDAYAQAIAWAGEPNAARLEALARASDARAALNAPTVGGGAGPSDMVDVVADLEAAAVVLRALPPEDVVATRAWIHVGRSHALRARAAVDAGEREAAVLSAFYAYRHARERAAAVGDARALAFALGLQGELYAEERRLDEALWLTRRALASAESGAPDVAFRWHWQEARVLAARGDAAAAQRSLRRAVAELDASRQEALARYGAAERFFRRRVAPVYLDLVASLLDDAAATVPGARRDDAAATVPGARRDDAAATVPGARRDDAAENPQDETALREARAVVEAYRAAELRDYFRDECVADLDARTATLDGVSDTAAIVYPILFPDRTELLVTLPSGLRRFTVPVGADEVRGEVRALQRSLQRIPLDAYRAPAERLDGWLVQPYSAVLRSEGVDTLVFVPDGPLRGLPLGALFDGETHLIERFALAVTPGLGLVDPRPLDRDAVRLVAGGLSRSVDGFEALPKVPEELSAVRGHFDGRVLLDEAFEKSALQRAIDELRPSVVHLASHAEFDGDPNESFLLTWDGRLTMNELADVVGRARFGERPLELLVLSACQTAAGDERAALGLAGVAVRAGARSALGSLWSISDDAAYLLIDRFYRELEDATVSKAVALQRAQVALLADERFSHPYFWSPFLLISNWL